VSTAISSHAKKETIYHPKQSTPSSLTQFASGKSYQNETQFPTLNSTSKETTEGANQTQAVTTQSEFTNMSNASGTLRKNNTKPLTDFGTSTLSKLVVEGWHIIVIRITLTILSIICFCWPLIYYIIPWCRLRWRGYRRLGDKNADRSLEMKEFEAVLDVGSFDSLDEQTPVKLEPSA